MPSPQGWFENLKAKGFDIRLELMDGGGHGMMFSDFTSSAKLLPGGRLYHISLGATADTRSKAQRLVLEFLESKLLN